MKYNVYGIMTASVFLGKYEAETEEEAIQMAENNDEADWSPGLCHQCAREIDRQGLGLANLEAQAYLVDE